jgi:hypothetical protein
LIDSIASRPELITRRSLLGAAVGAGALAWAPPALARATPGELFSRRVGRLDGGGAPLTIDPGRAFALVGVHWREPRAAGIELRARLADGRWSRWLAAGSAGHGPDLHEDPVSSVHAGEPLWTSSASEVQLRSADPVEGVTLHFVSDAVAGGTALTSGADRPRLASGAGALPLAQPRLAAGPGQPPIVARRAWSRGAGPRGTPAYGAVRLAFVHHTDNPNGYAAAQVPALIYAIYLYHRYSNGWNDIGYNFLIDAYGRIWEARAGGIDLPVIGAQAGGYNVESTGVAILGTFTSALPSAAALRALERLLAWKLALHGLPTTGEVEVEVDPSDAFYTPFRPGQRIALPRIAGHRQGCSTDCPGNALFAHLPQVRDAVSGLAAAPAALTLTAAQPPGHPAGALALAGETVAAGSTVVLAGTLRAGSGAPVAGSAVELQEVLAGGATRTLTLAATGGDGAFAVALPITRNMLLRALHPASPTVVSPLVAVEAASTVTVQLASSAPLRVTGTVAPATATVTVELFRAGARRALRTRTAHVSAGTFAATFPRPRAGAYTVIATAPATATNAAGVSAPLAVTV